MKAREGIELRYLSDMDGIVDPERIMDAADERTKVIFLCHVESTTGFRHDLSRIGRFCRERGIWFLVDAVQSAGILPVDIAGMNIDCLVGNDYKWLMSYCGTGYAYFSDALLAHIGEKMSGWFAVEEYVLRLRRLLEEAIETVPDAELCYNFAPENQSQIMKVRIKNAGASYPDYLKRNQVFANTEMEEQDCILRIGIHYYNDEADLNHLICVLGSERSA